jgi:putative phage-type endonuclease
MKIITMNQNSPEWHSWRRQGLGGSDAPVIAGESPYRTQLDLYREKTGLGGVEASEENEFIFAKGHAVEKLIRRQFQDLTGVRMEPVCLEHSEFSHIRGSLDGYDPVLGVLEAKLVGQAVLEKAREGEIPAHHMTQIQHLLAVSGGDLGQWFGHDGKKNGVLVEVRRNDASIRRLLGMEHDFWDRVCNRMAPPLSSRDYLVPEDLTLLANLREAKEHSANADAYYEQVKAEVVAKYKHDRIAGAGIKLFKVERQGSINYKSLPELAALDAEYLEKYRGAGSASWTIRLDTKKEAV